MSISRRRDKEAMVHTMGYDSAIKGDTFESLLMKWMSLLRRVKLSRKEENKYHILTHIYGI